MSKPAYLSIVEHSPTKPVIIFVPSRQQCRLTADDLLIHCVADDNEDRFLNIEVEDLQPHLDHISNRDLVETLKHGIGFYHEALSKQDKRIVERLFQSGAIQVLIASKVCVSRGLRSVSNTNQSLSGHGLESSRRQLYGYCDGRATLRRQRTSLRGLPCNGRLADDGPGLSTTRRRTESMRAYVPTDPQRLLQEIPSGRPPDRVASTDPYAS